MIYAPIIITTLNRYVHLKRCVESLNNNEWAKFTDLYISIDYPPEEKYVDGWKKITNYLKDFCGKFKSLNVYHQNTNLGPGNNVEFLKKIIEKKHDRYISLEDDNEVSPNFIEYMDKALDIASKNNSVFCVCSGFSTHRKNDIIKHLKKKSNHILLGATIYEPYGTGHLISKDKEFSEMFDEDAINSSFSSFLSMLELSIYNKQCFFLLNYVFRFLRKPICFRNGRIASIDIFLELFMIKNNYYAVYPSINMTRNWGEDGSGVNCGDKNIDVSKFELDSSKCFKLDRVIRLSKRNQYRLQARTTVRELLIGWYCWVYYKTKCKKLKKIMWYYGNITKLNN